MKRRDFNLSLLRTAGAGVLLGLTGDRVRTGLALSATPVADPRLEGAYRFSRDRWIYVHLQGTPLQIGFQHGYLLAPEIARFFKTVTLNDLHSSGKDKAFFRRASRKMLWPKIDPEYQEEIEGIRQGLLARGVRIDLDDLIWLNANAELGGYYVPWYDAQHQTAAAPPAAAPGKCSAFVATGSYTKGRQIVMAHSMWTVYFQGELCNLVFDIVPQHGYRILMDGFPGVIASDTDFGVNSSGLMITETTITDFHGWNPAGKPEFVRARKAMQYASSIDEYVRIMLDGNNGGYANDWLLGDRKTGEIAQLELGLKAYRVWRSKDGYFVSSNFARDPTVLQEDCPDFNPEDLSSSPNARRVRWEQLVKHYEGQINVELGRRFLSDHFDSYEKKAQASIRTLCGHGDLTPYGNKNFGTNPFDPIGAVNGKVVDSRMAQEMRFAARRGHPCGGDFLAQPFLKAHPEYAWEEPLLKDMRAGPWTNFKAGDIA